MVEKEKKFIEESFPRGGSVVFGFQTWKAKERDTLYQRWFWNCHLLRFNTINILKLDFTMIIEGRVEGMQTISP